MASLATFWLSLLLVGFSFYCYWQIHFERLDYSLDTSFLGFYNTAVVVVNEYSRNHVIMGVVVGMLLRINKPTRSRMLLAWVLFWIYTIRNIVKHVQIMYDGFHLLQDVPPPPPIRSSTTRQQLQFHMGIGIGIAVGGCVPSFNTNSSEGTSTTLLDTIRSYVFMRDNRPKMLDLEDPVEQCLWVLCVITAILGGYHVSLPPVPVDLKEKFRQAIEEARNKKQN